MPSVENVFFLLFFVKNNRLSIAIDYPRDEEKKRKMRAEKGRRRDREREKSNFILVVLLLKMLSMSSSSSSLVHPRSDQKANAKGERM
jgi:Nse4 C-terminal